jgi:hypothetical protein
MLGEQPTMYQAAGVVLVLTGVFKVRTKQRIERSNG